MIPQIITKEKKIVREPLREPLCMVPFTPTPEQIKIWNETYKELYSLLHKN